MGSLGINVWDLIVQLVAFVIFVWLLWRWALGPIVRVLDQRQTRIRESMEAAQKMQAELAETTAKNEEVLAQARQEAQHIVAQARESGERLVAQAQQAANAQSEEYLQRARETLQSETEQARQQLRQEVADLAVTAAGKIVRKELDPQTQARLIEETLTEAGASSNGRDRAAMTEA